MQTEKKKSPKLDFNTGLFLQELRKRKVRISPIGSTKVYKASYKDHTELICDLNVSTTSFPAGWITGDKFYTKKILQHAGIPVAEGKVFTYAAKQDALGYAKKLGFPLVLKPAQGTHGDYVYVGIDSPEELQKKIDVLTEEYIGNGYYLIEKYLPGEEYRIFYTENDFFAVVHRLPAHITGDGKQSIFALIKNENYNRMNPRKNCLCEIRFDDILFDHLEKTGKNIDDVPKKGEVVQLRLSSNVSKGGNCYDVTGQTHPSVKKLAKKILSTIAGLSYVGIDLICKDIRISLQKQNYFVCELNPVPGLSLHCAPEKGLPQNTPGALVNLLFPESKDK